MPSVRTWCNKRQKSVLAYCLEAFKLVVSMGAAIWTIANTLSSDFLSNLLPTCALKRRDTVINKIAW